MSATIPAASALACIKGPWVSFGAFFQHPNARQSCIFQNNNKCSEALALISDFAVFSGTNLTLSFPDVYSSPVGKGCSQKKNPSNPSIVDMHGLVDTLISCVNLTNSSSISDCFRSGNPSLSAYTADCYNALSNFYQFIRITPVSHCLTNENIDVFSTSCMSDVSLTPRRILNAGSNVAFNYAEISQRMCDLNLITKLDTIAPLYAGMVSVAANQNSSWTIGTLSETLAPYFLTPAERTYVDIAF